MHPDSTTTSDAQATERQGYPTTPTPTVLAFLRRALLEIEKYAVRVIHEAGFDGFMREHFLVMRFPMAQGETARTIAGRLAVPIEQVEALLADLEAKDYLTRSDDAERRVDFTRRGWKCAAVGRATIRQFGAEVARLAGADRFAAFLEVLKIVEGAATGGLGEGLDPPVDTMPRHGVFLVTAGPDVGRVITLADETTFGRDPRSQAWFTDDRVAPRHAVCIRRGEAYVLEDLSDGSTFVNARRASGPLTLREGDAVALGGSTRLRFAMLDALERDALVGMYESQRRRPGRAQDAESEADLADARALQRRVLGDLPELPGVRVEALYRPLHTVGGDLYRLHVLPGGALRVFIADAVGHGVQASLTTMLVLSAYEPCKDLAAPEAVLAALNEAFATTYGHLGVQLSAAVLDLDFARGELSYANAAHPPALVVRGGAIEALDVSGPFLGLMPGLAFDREVVALRPGDRVVAYTDGCTEVFSPRDEMLGDAGLRAVLLAADGALPEAVSRSIDAFADGRPLSDDITCVAIAWVGDPPDADSATRAARGQ